MREKKPDLEFWIRNNLIKMNKVQDISTPLATVVSRDFLNDPTPIGADQIFLKKEEERKAKVSTGNKNSYWKWQYRRVITQKITQYSVAQ